MTMTPEEKLAMARECAGLAYRSTIPSDVLAGYVEAGAMDYDEAVQSALLAIDRMQERVRAETERCLIKVADAALNEFGPLSRSAVCAEIVIAINGKDREPTASEIRAETQECLQP